MKFVHVLQSLSLAALGLLCALVLVAPTASAAKFKPGQGYYIVVCDAAAAEGYSGDLQKFFKSVRTHYVRAGDDPYGDIISKAGSAEWSSYSSTGADPAPKKNWDVDESCGGNGIGVYHKNDDATIPAKIGAPGGSGWKLKGSVPTGEGLAITELQMDDHIRGYKTLPADSVKRVDSFWGTDERHAIRGCTNTGAWGDSAPMGGSWKDGDVASTGAGGASDTDFLMGSTDPQFYRQGPGGEYGGMMTGSGTNANPNARCRITGGTAAYKFGSVHQVEMVSFCNSRAADSTVCRGTKTSLPDTRREQGDARSNAMSHGAFIRANSVRIFVSDSKDPSLDLSGQMDASGGYVGDGEHAKETLTYTAKDNVGIKDLRFYVDGKLQRHSSFLSLCDYRMRVPCPKATVSGGPGGSIGTTFLFDADSLLPEVLHTITVEATDGSGRVTTKKATFKVQTPQRWEFPCERDMLIGGTGKVCDTSNPTEDNSEDESEDPDPVADEVQPPEVEEAIFTYDVAFNPTPTARSPDPANCKVIEHVASGNGAGGALLERELNQVIAITIDLRGFARSGAALGQQDLRATFDMPSRNTPRYRAALGCPA